MFKRIRNGTTTVVDLYTAIAMLLLALIVGGIGGFLVGIF